MYANLASGVHVMDSNILENGKTVDHYTGALHLYYVFDELTISNTLFHSNHAKTFAGCILFGDSSGPKSAKYQLSFCFFRNNTATQLGGNDIHISNNNCNENLTDRNLTGCYSLTEGVRVSKCTSGGYDCSENQTYTNWLPDIPSAYETSVDSRSGMDRSDCGYAPLCQTIHFAFGRIEARSSNKIGVKAGKCVEEETEVSSRSVVVEGEQREGCRIESDGSGGCVFGITTGHFVGRSVTLVHKNSESGGGGVFLAMTDNGIVDLVGCNVESAAGEEALQAPFMTMSRGVATLEDVKMEGMRFGGRGAIQGSAPGSGCGIVVKESNMSGMEVSEGNGSVVCFALGGGGEVVVSSCKVSGCGCESGCGGSVCVKMEGGGRVVVNGTERTQFELCRAGAGRDGAGGLGGAVFVETNRGGGEVWMGNTTFERCTAKKGAKVFVSISDLSSVIVRERFLVEHTAEDAEALSGFDRDRSGETGYVPLIVFVEQWGGRAFVAGEEGAEHYRCGFSFYACSTIEKAVEHRFASGKRRMVLEAPFVFDHEMVFSGEEYEMEGRQAQNEIRIDGASGAGQSGLLCVQTGVAVSDVVFVLPMSIGGRNVFVRCESHELRLVRCTLRPVGSLSSSPSFATGVAACTLLREEQRKMTYSFVCVVDSALRVESLVVDRGMCLQRSSVIGCSGVCDVELRGCVFEGVEKTEGSGACVEGEVRGEGTKREGRIVVEGCTFRRCKTAEQESSGGGVCAALWGKSTLVVNGTGVFEECKASEGSSGKGRGGGVMIRVNDEESWLGICRGVVFSREKPNWARWGRDVFVDCGSGVLLEGKISAESVGFADPLEMADDALGVCGVENGSAVPVIPLFVYLLVQPGRIRVDGRSGADHVFCGFELFECLTVDYCFEERSSVNASRIEVCSEARLGAEMKVESFGLSICSQSEAEARVDVEDEGARSEEGLISCSFPFSASGTLFWLARRLQVGREWLILSRESLRLSKCRVGFGFEDGESAGFGAICVVGGRMELRECVLSVEAELEKKAAVDVRGYSTVNVAGCVFEGWRNGRGDGGSMAIRSEGGEAGSAEIRNTTINGCSCVGGCELKGGGMSIAISEEDEFVVHNASLNRCSVPSGSSEACGAERGVGGGVFVEAVGGAAGFALREMKFSGCDGWKGKNVFVCGRELDRIVDKEHLNWTMSSDELEQLEWMSGWEMSSTGTRLAIPLAVYLWGNFSMEGYVDGAGGEDFSGCGQPVIPCKTIDGMVSMRLGRATATSKCVIGVLGESAARGAVELSKAGSYKLCGCGERRRIVVEDGGGGAQRGYFGCHVECRFEKAEFAVPDELSGQLRMKSVEFEENVAWRGRNAYVVCEGARAMIQYELWKGTTTEETIEENDLWVYEKGSTGEGETMRKHLFPGNEMIVYVDSSGREGEGCGAYDDYDFCADLVSGYAVMKGAQHILHIAKDAALNGELMRTRDPLTIRGGKEKSVMRVGEGGHLVQKSEVESNTLVLSQLVVELGSGGGVEAELVLVEKGRVAVDNCAFGEESVGRGSGMWIIGMSGGRCMMDNVSVRNMEFEEGCGVVRVDGGTAEIGCSNLTACRTDGKGLVVGGEGGDVKISGCAFLGCEAGGGSAVRLCGGSSGRIGNGSVFEECLTQGGEGGAMKWELSGGGRCTMDGAGVRRNCAEGEEGRGGGVFVGIVEEGDTNFEFGSGVEFGGNRAQAGKDVNVMCSSLNSSIQASRFLFELRSGEGVWRCGMEGTDESMFEGVDVDLMLFLVEYKGESVYVWSEGMDVAGCGKQEVECRSFWRGLKNLRDGAGEKKVFVKGWTSIADCHDVSGLRISARDDGETSELRVGSKLPSGSGGGVLSSTASLAIVSQVFVLPSSFDGEVGCVISSRTREGLLVLSGCSFSLVEEGGNGEAGEGRLGYELVCVEGGSAAMEDCRIRWMEFEKSPLLFVEARVSLENCVLDGVLSGGGGGGAARAVCGEEGVFVVEGGEFGGCENVGAGSKGGVFFVDSRTSRMAEPFGLREIRVEGTNKAEIGKQLFIASDDLNKTVREETMGCVVGLSGMDENSCVGWEERFGVIDVRVFLVKAVLEVVAVSARGHNILGCGKDEMPCETVWEGMRHLDLGSREKALVIVDEALVCDDLDVSDVKIGGMGSEEDEKHLSRIRFEKSGEGCGEGGGEMGNGVMRNKGVFEMWMMEVGAGEGFGNAEGALIVSERGRVVVRESVFEGRGEDGERNEFALVEIAGGELVMENVEMKGVCVRGCVVRMREGSEMRAEGLSVGMARLYDGSVVEVGEGLGAENGKKGTVVEMNKSEIVDVKREVGRGCVVDERGEGLRGSVSVRMVGVRMHTCQSLGSLEGGGVFGELRGEGQMESGFVKRIVCCLGGVLVGKNVEMRMLDVVCGVVCKEGMVEVEGMKASNMDCGECLMRCEDSFVGIDGMSANGICVGKGPLVEVDGKGKDKTGERNGKSWMRGVRAENMSSGGETAVLKVERWMDGEVTNCSFGRCDGEGTGGRLMVLGGCKGVVVSTCVLDGRGRGEGDERRGGNWEGEVCKWNGSAGEFEGCEAVVKDTTVSNSGEGGLSVCGGSVEIEDGKFENNNPSIEGYPSMRRNILCSDNGVLNVMSLKGGDGWERNTSLWILNEGCELGGIASERASSLFIPVVEEARNETASDGRTIITLSGRLLLPCNVWLKLSFRNGREEVVESYGVGERESVSENEIVAAVSSGQMAIVGAETEVSVSLLFGNLDTPSATDSFILKNRSDPKATEDERIVEGGKKERSIWPIIVIVLVVILLIVLIVAVAFIIRWKKAKDENNDLREIVNDNIRKDPKAFEMVTMEMSPEEQWRRAEREAEKKNEERIKRRVYAKSLQHSESSEHLLSENGSTEYIFGSDSDKIPQWILEKVDEKEEEEETNKRTPSPSVSSTSTTDSDSSFVRVEDLCPTTSSMSNLVDAMACSSPHEKLIVDLRDSLFMLLHGRNKTKEMAIGCLQEREQTAAQILFWVANGALHSFDECEVPLQSLTNLSPHIVLFSEHMVICIAKHSDFSSDDFESSSISSSSVFTSASDDDDRDSLLSSAFEDEDDFKKECLRWKAPELLNGRKKHATKKTVVLSVGMMMWECLTLDVPFGKYEAEVAGQKMVNGERPCGGESEASGMHEMVKGCWKADSGERPTLPGVTRKCFEFFPAGATVVTMSDAVGCEGGSEDAANSEEMESMIGESELSVVRGSPAQ
eukprot:MONOS_12533.1-p1 / transcript=MONOS_12533.1 / gene=MONOS_12533 / organism=Monocercomonoides_exilis_PA203 / gene_product=unspecified product / transcript_product=unspecified product / location=Mono_scaffold00698:18673-29577(+) / protein_length=3223 / sequence_SO=supercontig / SO=protein_coding / is_pseudo=false